MKKLFLIIFATLLIVCGAAYTAFWYGLAYQLEKQVTIMQVNALASGIDIEGDISPVRGFPRAPEISFAGEVMYAGTVFDIPYVSERGFPFPHQPLTIALPEGMQIVPAFVNPAFTNPAVNDPASDIYRLDYAHVRFIIPPYFPADATVESLRAWRAAGGAFTVPAYELRKNELVITGKGQLTLDQDLQPAGTLEARIEGHTEFLGYLQTHKLLDRSQSLLAATVLNGLSRRDEETGATYMKAALTLQNRRILLGPLQILALPPLVWPYADQLARPE